MEVHNSKEALAELNRMYEAYPSEKKDLIEFLVDFKKDTGYDIRNGYVKVRRLLTSPNKTFATYYGCTTKEERLKHINEPGVKELMDKVANAGPNSVHVTYVMPPDFDFDIILC